MRFSTVAVLSAFSATALAQTSLDLVSVYQVLQTALPSSLVQEALTNSDAVSSQIASQFAAGQTPSWFQSLPADIQTFLISGAGATDAPSSNSATATNDAATTGATTGAETTATTGGSGNLTATASEALSSIAGGLNSAVSSGTRAASSAGASASSRASSATAQSTGGAAPNAVYGAGIAGAAGLLGLLAL